MHGLYKRFLLFCAVFVALIFAVVGFWLLLGVTCSCAVLVLAYAGAPVRPVESRSGCLGSAVSRCCWCWRLRGCCSGGA